MLDFFPHPIPIVLLILQTAVFFYRDCRFGPSQGTGKCDCLWTVLERDLRHTSIVHTTTVYPAWRWLTRPKHFTYDKLLIKLCLDLFFISFINGTGNISSYSISISTTHPHPTPNLLFDICVRSRCRTVNRHTPTRSLWCYCAYILLKFISIEYIVIFEENRPPGRPRSKWEGNIQMGLQEIGAGADGLIQFKIRINGGLFWTR
jgi:hypothetical protein